MDLRLLALYVFGGHVDNTVALPAPPPHSGADSLCWVDLAKRQDLHGKVGHDLKQVCACVSHECSQLIDGVRTCRIIQHGVKHNWHRDDNPKGYSFS